MLKSHIQPDSFSGKLVLVSHHPGVKNFFLTSNLNLPFLSVMPFYLVPSLHDLVKSPPPALLKAPLRYWKGSKVSSEPPLLQADQPRLSQFVSTGEVLQSTEQPCNLHCTCSSKSISLFWDPRAGCSILGRVSP